MVDAAVLAAIRDVLVAVARDRRTIGYDELLRALEDDARASAQADLSRYLRALSIDEDDAGRGLLSAVVVRADGLPGAGWFQLASLRGRDATNADRQWVWESEIARVFAAWRPQ